MKIFLIVVVIVILVLGGGVLLLAPTLMDGLPSFSSGPIGTPVRMEKVEVRPLVESVPAPGVIEPHTKVDISAQVVAEVIALPFREGEIVRKGDIVVQLDDRALEARLLAARASLESMKANADSTRAGRARTEAQLNEQMVRHKGLLASLEFAERNLARKQELYDTEDVTMSELDVARERVLDIQTQINTSTTLISGAESSLAAADAQILQAEASVKQAEAEIKLAEEALRNSTITSPIDGRVTRLNAEVGETVMTGTMNNAGTVIMTIADLTRMKMIARIAESDIAKLGEGQTARVYINAYQDEVFDGVVDRIALQRTNNLDGTGHFEAEIMLRLDGREVKSGHDANVDVEIATHQGLVIPSQAVVDRNVDDLPPDVVASSAAIDRTKRTVRVVYRVVDGQAVVTPVRVGASDLTHRLILEGLSEGDTVVTGPYKVLDTIHHGDRVTDVAATPQPDAAETTDATEAGGETS